MWPDKRGLNPQQKVMLLGVGAGRRRLITIGSRLASNNDGSASVHPDTLTLIPQREQEHDGAQRREKGVVDICRCAPAWWGAEQRLLSSISRLAGLGRHPSASHWSHSSVRLDEITFKWRPSAARTSRWTGAECRAQLLSASSAQRYHKEYDVLNEDRE